ncbi:hypothetical protein [Pseudarthrobacter sp. CCNWLW207]|uniref:hypothetical protein n=1 Tax=Pseudarthrobacter sp. CCNWLW207 TaxID=3127468 RepID=UPI00307792B9
MNQQSFGQTTGRATAAGPDGSSGSSAGKGQPEPAIGKAGSRHQAVLGHFTVRDLTVFAATLILFVTSLLPVFLTRFNLWNVGNLFFLGLGIVLPLIVSALFAARRLAPATKVRIGSLSVDQFASVVASFAVAFFFLSVAGDYHPALLAGLIGSVILFAATVLGRFIPYFASDFEGRQEVPAHVVARESAVPLPKPRMPKAPKEPTAPEEAKPVSGASPDKDHAAVPGAAAGATGFSTGPAAAAGSSAVSSSIGHTGPQTVTTPGTSPYAPVQPSLQEAQPAQQVPQPAQQVPAPAQKAQPVQSRAADTAAVSSAPEVSEWPSEGDFGPPTQAADVVPPAVVAAADEAHGSDTPAVTPARQASDPIPATAVHPQVRKEEPIGATVDPASRPEESEEHPVHEAFWFAVAQHRTAVDPRTGAPAFVIEPGGWVLALEDRGHEFLVQHTDGRVGVLRDLSNIERG